MFLAQSGTDAALGTLQRPPWGWRGLSTGRQKPHGAAGVAKPARASRRCSAIQRRSRQGHSAGHVPVPWVTWPQGGQSCPEPRQCIFPPSDARGTIPSHGHNPGTPLTLAHIWPWRTSGPGAHLAPAHICPQHTSHPGTHLASAQPHPHPAPYRRRQPPGGRHGWVHRAAVRRQTPALPDAPAPCRAARARRASASSPMAALAAAGRPASASVAAPWVYI